MKTTRKTTIKVLNDKGWEETTLYRLKKDNVCKSISIKTYKEDYESTLYTCYRPAKPRGMTPVAYYRKYQCVPEKYTDKVNGRYYCNPYHCSRSWTDKSKRDEHLEMAYRMLS